MSNEGLQTVRDLLSGFNTMQMHLGLTPLSGSATGFAQAPSPVMAPPPVIKHPAQVAHEAAAQISMQTRKAVEDRHATSMYGQEFGQRIAQVQSNYMSPHQAQAYAGMSGQAGFSGMPSPVFQTPPSMGIFRPGFAPAPSFSTPPMMPSIGRPNMPFMGSSGMNLGNLPGMGMFAGTPPAPMFTDPYERQIHTQQLQNSQNFAAGMARIPTLAEGVGTAATGLAGAGAGALFMGRIGGGGGIGGAIGALAGGIGGLALGMSTTGPAAGRMAESHIAQPLMERRAYGEQLMGMSQNFVTQGASLSPLGRGLTQRSSIQLGNQMMRDVEGGKTGGFNMRDMMKIAGQASDQGMLDMAQNEGQISAQMRNIAKGLQSFMRIAQEPDVKRAMQQMGAMRSMGLSIPETSIAAHNAQTFSKMAGTSVSSLMQNAGMPGAMTFQQMGLTAGLGMQVGMGAAGMAGQAVAGGAFTPAQLALAGGRSGLQQTLTESAGAALGNNFQTMALLSRNEGGQLSIDPERLKRVMSGHVTLSQQAGMAADNLQRLAQQGGVSPEQVTSELSTQINELRDEMGRRLGPMGGNMLTIRNAMALQKETGIGFGGALRKVAPGLSTNQVRSLEVMSQSPEAWTGMQQHLLRGVGGIRGAASARNQAAMDEGGFSGALRKSWVGGAGRAISGEFGGIGEEIRSGFENVSTWFSDSFGGQKRDANGAMIIRTPEGMGVSGKRERKILDRFVKSDAYDRAAKRYGSFAGKDDRTPGDLTGGQLASSIYGLGRAAVQVGATFGGGGIGGGIAASLLPEATTANESDVNRAFRRVGGAGGFFAKNAGWAVNIGMSGDHMKPARDYLLAQEKGFMTVGQQLKEGERLTASGMKVIRKGLKETFNIGMGGDEGSGSYEDFEDDAVNAAIETLSSMTGWTGGREATETEIKEGIIEKLVSKGASRDHVTRQINTDWKAGLSQIVMRRAHREGNKSSKSVSSKYLEESSNFSGKNLKEVMKKAKKFSEGTNTLIGGKEFSGFSLSYKNKVSEAAAKEYSDFAVTASPEEMMIRKARALRARDEEGDEAAAQLLLDNAKAIAGEDKFRKAMKKVDAHPIASESLIKTLATSADASSGLSAKKQYEREQELIDRPQYKKIQVAIMKGAERIAEQEGVSVDAVLNREEYQGKGGREKLYKKGLKEGSSMAVGGRGQGSAAEEAVRNQVASIAQLAEEIPKFKEATQLLKEGATKLHHAISAKKLKIPNPRGDK